VIVIRTAWKKWTLNWYLQAFSPQITNLVKNGRGSIVPATPVTFAFFNAAFLDSNAPSQTIFFFATQIEVGRGVSNAGRCCDDPIRSARCVVQQSWQRCAEVNLRGRYATVVLTRSRCLQMQRSNCAAPRSEKVERAKGGR
jgi:hypothetical protein